MASDFGSSASVDPNNTGARLSSPWSTDDTFAGCSKCSCQFNQLSRRHHCRLCGHIFCHKCTTQRALIPPSSIVLVPRGGKKIDSRTREDERNKATFQEEGDPDREITYMRSPSGAAADASAGHGGSSVASVDPSLHRSAQLGGDAILYGRGLEERAKLAREPLRVCDTCHEQLSGVQDQLRLSNANAMRYNAIDPTDVRRLFNSPLAFTLGHEIRKVRFFLRCCLSSVVSALSPLLLRGGF